MSGGVTRLRSVLGNPGQAQRVAELQAALASEVALLEQGLIIDLQAMQERLEEMAQQPLKPGVKELFRQLSETVRAGLLTLESIRGR